MENLIHQQFGALTVVEYAGREQNQRHHLYRSICECGGTAISRASDLKRGKTTNCGCVRRAKIKEIPRKTVHGMFDTPEYDAYRNAKARCSLPHHPDWPGYGGRGIEFRFTSFGEFLAAVGLKPSPEMSIDRIDNDGHYEVGNVRWATASQQTRNQRKRRWWKKPPQSASESMLASA